MIKIAICDDEQAEIEYLTTQVRIWAKARATTIRISAFRSAESFLFLYEDDPAVDVLLLDIQMAAMDGVSLAKKIRKANREVQIVFITGYMDYIADGYDVEALHYLLKPVTEDKLYAILDRAMEKLERNESFLLLSHAGEMMRIPLYEIRYIEVWQNYVTIHADKDYTLKQTLGELEKKLDNSFFRTGRSHIVNLRYVRKSTRSEVYLADGSVIPLSRRLYEAFNRSVIERL